MNHLLKGLKGEIAETPKSANPAFKRVKNIIIGNNKSAAAEAEKKAKNSAITRWFFLHLLKERQKR